MARAEGSSPVYGMASGQDSTGVCGERGMATQGKRGNLGELRVSLLLVPEEQGYRLTKSPGAGRELPAVSEPLGGTQTEEADKVSGSARKRSDPRRTRGGRSGA